MKRLSLISALLSLLLILSISGCAQKPSVPQESKLTITATTYPLYVLACAITAESDHVEVHRLNTGSVSCLHDYTLTVSDMRYLEQSDVLIMNGAGLETFLNQALNHTKAVTLDCSAAVHLLERDTHEHHDDHSHSHSHDHSHEHDAHYWMDPRNMICAAEYICEALAAADPEHAELYRCNTDVIRAALDCALENWEAQMSALTFPYLITFHDGFYYFAQSFGLELLFSMEEEDGATASAKDICEAASIVKEYSLPAIFTETNGSGAAARAVSGETGVSVAQLSMLMSGKDAAENAAAEEILQELYIEPMSLNIETILEVLK